jgi:hypothetical protein
MYFLNGTRPPRYVGLKPIVFAGEPATGYGALPLSYARRLRTATAAGFEPATSQLTVEVTHVFTTGKASFVSLRAKPLRSDFDN